MEKIFMGEYDIIVVGAGHAGCEAGLAAARMGNRTLVLSINLEAVAMMACNPSIGGTGKGHLVREIDALGGEMGKNIDKTFIQSKMLNTAKGQAVYSLRAQADKESQILAAEAEKQSMILRADAVKEQKILEAEGEAQAIDMVQKAIAESIVKLNAANPNEQVIQLKSLEAFAKAADGKATKIIIPSEIQGIAGLATGLKEVMTDVKKPQ